MQIRVVVFYPQIANQQIGQPPPLRRFRRTQFAHFRKGFQSFGRETTYHVWAADPDVADEYIGEADEYIQIRYIRFGLSIGLERPSVL
jgi:hypothetical protein